MIDTQVIGFLAVVAGAFCGLVIPAVLKMKEEGQTFEMSYLYGLCISVVVAAFALVPSEVTVTFSSLMVLFLAGVGMQGIINKGNTTRLKMAK
jgi:O-antigen/teichoic acid export membrane protein